MPPSARQLSLFYLTFIWLAAGIDRCQAVEVSSVDVMENDWYTFQCDYNPAADKQRHNELGVTVQRCDVGLVMAGEPAKFNLVAAVFGKLTATSEEMKQRYMNNEDIPVYYPNTENIYVKDQLVKITDGSLSSIIIEIHATARTDRICAVCGQSAGTFGYTVTKKVSLKMHKPLNASLSLNSNPVPHNDRRDVQQGEAARIVCTAEGPETLSVTLLKNDAVFESATNNSVTYEISTATKGNAGVYKCEASTTMQFLRSKNSFTASTEFVLAVKFAPEFEVSDEIVRYTKLNEQENIKIRVLAYPPATLECQPDQIGDVKQQESYSDQEYAGMYQLTLSNLNTVDNQTSFDCTASNSMGEKKLKILLTAKAPTPTILSDGKTDWHNSYQLRWKHDQSANIDFYQVEIAYKAEGQVVNRSMTKFDPKAQKGKMALVDGTRQSGQIVHSGVLFGLNPDSQHDIRLQSCNQHGCSEFSAPIDVKTPSASASSYNDPNNPEKRSLGKSSTTTRSGLAFMVACAFCSRLLAMHCL